MDEKPDSPSSLYSPSSTDVDRWRRATLLSLLVGYAGYYFCRSNLSVATPLLLESFVSRGLTKESLGLIATSGALFYAVGKMASGVLVDYTGGRRMFLFGMAASVLCTILFGLGTGFGALLVVWSLNLLVQSPGWNALVRITAHAFPAGQYGRVMGVLCLSFLLGDLVTRLFLSQLLQAGWGWRGLFFASAGALAAIFLILTFTLKERPGEAGEDVGEAGTVFRDRASPPRDRRLRNHLAPFVKSPSFWVIAFMSMGLTFIRESFHLWTPTYLTEAAGLPAGQAAQWSMLYPLFGCVSMVVSGYASDRYAHGQRGPLLVGSLALLALILLAMGVLPRTGSAALPVVAISAVAFFLFGPYSFLEGAISLDLGGRRGGATAAGFIGGAGYFGALLSGYAVGALAERSGWNAVFLALSGVAGITLITAVYYWLQHERVSHTPDVVAASSSESRGTG
ncbi:MAG: MFS transporter [Armatimonadetes bacterium]|nr:MFS transporter [Armatimonadota bacterium]